MDIKGNMLAQGCSAILLCSVPPGEHGASRPLLDSDHQSSSSCTTSSEPPLSNICYKHPQHLTCHTHIFFKTGQNLHAAGCVGNISSLRSPLSIQNQFHGGTTGSPNKDPPLECFGKHPKTPKKISTNLRCFYAYAYSVSKRV